MGNIAIIWGFTCTAAVIITYMYFKHAENEVYVDEIVKTTKLVDEADDKIGERILYKRTWKNGKTEYFSKNNMC